MRYCGIIEPCGTRFLILLGNGIGKRSFAVLRQIAALFICPLLSKTGWYFLDFTFNGQWLHTFWLLIYDEVGRVSNYRAFR